MSRKYKFHHNDKLYFISFAVVYMLAGFVQNWKIGNIAVYDTSEDACDNLGANRGRFGEILTATAKRISSMQTLYWRAEVNKYEVKTW